MPDIRNPSAGAGGVSPADVDLLSQGRLTLLSLDPAPIADQIGKSTVYFTPYKGNTIALWTGAAWEILIFSEVSIVLAGLTNGVNYDVFGYDNAGVLTLELSAGWASNTLRTDALALQDGVRVKAADHTRRYIGTIRATGAATTEDSQESRFVMNWYNRIRRALAIVPGYVDNNVGTVYTTASTTWVTASVAIGGSKSIIQFLSNGEDSINCRAYASGFNNLSSIPLGIGLDSQTVASVVAYGGTPAQNDSLACELNRSLSEGCHTFDLLVGAFAGTSQYSADIGRVLGGNFDTPATGMVADIMA